MANTKQDTESRGKYFLAAFLAPLIWGFMAIPLRWVKNTSAEDLLYYRILIALILLWGFILLFRKKSLHQDIVYFKSLPDRSKKKVLYLTVLASIFIFCNWGTYIYAVNHISIQSAAFAYLICPILTAILAFFILREQLSNLKKLSLLLAFISVLLLASGSLIDVIWSITIALFYALYLIIQRSVQGFDKLNILAIQLLICSFFVVPRLVFNQHQFPESLTFWGTMLLIALVFTIIPLYFSMYALTKISSTTTGVLLYVNPIIAFTLAVTYFQEQVDPHKYWAYSLILMAIIIFNADKIFFLLKKKKHL